MTNEELIRKASSVVNIRKTEGGLFADVGCALISGQNQVYLGVCAASGSNVFCAEKNAIGSMLTDGEYRIKKIVAVWKDEQGNIFVIPPCGNCRQFMREVHEENLQTEVVLDRNKSVLLKELLPYYDWWEQQHGM